MKDIVIIGAGGFGREVAWLIEDINQNAQQWNIVGFVDDNEKLQGQEYNGYKVVGNTDWLTEQEYYVINAIADPFIKKIIMIKLKESQNIYPTIIHPSVIFSKSTSIGKGTIICAGSVLTVNSKVGNHVSINPNVTVGHDTKIEDYSSILPGANISGNIVLESGVLIGAGAVVIQNLTVGENSIIGAGAVVVGNIESNCTAVGVPAKSIKYHNQRNNCK